MISSSSGCFCWIGKLVGSNVSIGRFSLGAGWIGKVVGANASIGRFSLGAGWIGKLVGANVSIGRFFLGAGWMSLSTVMSVAFSFSVVVVGLLGDFPASRKSSVGTGIGRIS